MESHMESPAQQRRFAEMTIESNVAPGTLMEFIALCSGARVFSEELMGTRARKYEFARLAVNKVSISPKEDERDLKSDEDLLEPVKMMLGAMLLGAEVQVQGSWRHRFPHPTFFQKNLSTADMITDVSRSVHDLIDLSLSDLDEIHRLLTGQTKTVYELLDDSEFRAACPSIDSRYGMYGGIRHRSGVEVKIDWTKDWQIKYHVIEAPSPCEHILEKWIASSGMKIDLDDGFGNARVKLWKLAKMLGRVPQKHKQRVYEWVNGITFDIEEYHSTRGGHPVPESSDCEFESGIISVNRNLDFEMVEV